MIILGLTDQDFQLNNLKMPVSNINIKEIRQKFDIECIKESLQDQYNV